jgi:cysteine desulfurase/selenocysteine lyase
MTTATMPSVKADFPVANQRIAGSPLTYLDSAATSLKPQSVIDAIVKYYAEVGANIHRGKHMLSEIASMHFEETRLKVGRFLGCAGPEVVFVQNTTHGLNLIARGLGLDSTRDRVVVQGDAHHSAMLPWREVAAVDYVRVLPSGTPDLDHYAGLLQKRPRVVVLTHCSNVTGLYSPLEQMSAMAKKAGAIVVVDAAQSVPHRPFNLHQSHVDFIAFSAHKMLGPTGIGVLCGRIDLLRKLQPVTRGGGMVEWVEYGRDQARDVPHRLEAGTPDIAGVYGLGAAIDYLSEVGPDAVTEHDRQLARLMLSEARKRDGLTFVAGDESTDRSAILSFSIAGSSMAAVATALSDSHAIMCRSGHMCCHPFVHAAFGGEVLRASAYLYTTEADIATFFDAIDEVRRYL